MIRTLPVPRAIPPPAFGLLVFGVLASLSTAHLVLYQERPWALIALAAVPIGGAFVTRRPAMTAAAIIGGSGLLMVAYVDTGGADQTMLARAALESFLSGNSPYRVYDFGGWSNPFAYGPLSMLTALAWPTLEILAGLTLLAVLAWSGAWVTFGLVAGLPLSVHLALTGINDYTPALLVLVGLLALRAGHMPLGMVTLAVATAIKPYAAAWFLPAVGFAGWQAGWFIGASALLWAPVLPFAGQYVAMTSIVAGIAGFPPTRLLAVPFGVASLLARRWSVMTLLGAGNFAAVTLFGNWASLGLWIVVLPAVGVALELGDDQSTTS